LYQAAREKAMQKTFDHLLGLSARNALAVLAGYGITGVRVTLTGAPSIGQPPAPVLKPAAPERVSALQGMSAQFSVGDDEGEAESFDPLLDPTLDDGMLVEARVVAVRDDGRQLIVARFHTGEPKPASRREPQ